MCAGAGKWSLKIAREWSNARVQWGKPVGEHEAVGKKIAYIAASTFALESVFELSAGLADAGMKDVRIEAALAKLFSSEVSCKIADELVQIRGGRGYETADPSGPAANARSRWSSCSATCGSTGSSRAPPKSCT